MRNADAKSIVSQPKCHHHLVHTMSFHLTINTLYLHSGFLSYRHTSLISGNKPTACCGKVKHFDGTYWKGEHSLQSR